MEDDIARNFFYTANQLISNVVLKEALYTMLKTYQQDLDLHKFVGDLKNVIVSPPQLPLYDEIRAMIPREQQLVYDSISPRPPTNRLRIIRLSKQGTEALGFAVRGGLEHGTGLFISNVTRGSQAYAKGLRKGDEIVRVNGFTIRQAIHEDSLNLIQAKPHIVLKVRAIGMIPVKDNYGEELRWIYVDKDEGYKDKTIRVFIHLTGATGLGCSICSGPSSHPGTFIQSIKGGGAAEGVGLSVADQIISVNQTSFYDITHAEAVVALKGVRELFITYKKGAGAMLFSQDDVSQNTENNLNANNSNNNNSREITEEERLGKEDRMRLDNEDFEEFRLRQERKFAEADKAYLEQERLKNESDSDIIDDVNQGMVIVSGDMSELDSIETPSQLSMAFSQSFSQHGVTKVDNLKTPVVANVNLASLFTAEQVDGRQIEMVRVMKGAAFDMEIEGGLGSPIGGKIIISDVYIGGTVASQGGIHKGDQLMMVDGCSLLDVTKGEAQTILDTINNNTKNVVEFVVAKSPPKHYEDEVTYF